MSGRGDGLTPRKLALYGGLVAVLVAANLVLRAGRPQERAPGPDAAAPAILAETPRLAIAGELDAPPPPAGRALFQAEIRVVAPPPPEPARPAVRAAPPPPDPVAEARAAAARDLEAMRLVGVMTTGRGLMAMVKHGDNTLRVYDGDPLIGGFAVVSISGTSLTVSDADLGMGAVYSMIETPGFRLTGAP